MHSRRALCVCVCLDLDLRVCVCGWMATAAGTDDDGDDFNTVFVYDSNDGYEFYDAEPYHQFHSNFFGNDYEDW